MGRALVHLMAYRLPATSSVLRSRFQLRPPSSVFTSVPLPPAA